MTSLLLAAFFALVICVSWWRPRIVVLMGVFLIALGTATSDFKDTFKLKWSRGKRGGMVETA